MGPGEITTGRVTCLARTEAAAFYVLLLPRVLVQFGRNRLWRLRDRLVEPLPGEVRELLTRRRAGVFATPTLPS